MKKLLFLISLISLTNSGFSQYKIKYNNEFPRTDSIKGDLNGDGINDLIVVHYDKYIATRMNVKIYFQDISGNNTLIVDKHFFDEAAFRPPILDIKEGYIVYQFADKFSENQYVYKYSSRLNDWYCYFSMRIWANKEEEELGIDKSTPFYWGPLTIILGDTLNKHVSITTPEEQKKVWDKFNQNFQTYLNEYKTKEYIKLYKVDENEILEYLNIIGVNDSSLQKLNDIAFFLVEYAQGLKSNNKDHYIKAIIAIKLLENIICHYETRMVTYLNLGDAYWLLENKGFAKKSYQKYIELMRASSKESQIPKRVWDRVK